MSPIETSKFDSRAGWKVSSLNQDSSWRFFLNEVAQTHLRNMIKSIFDKDRPIFDYHASEFDLGPAHSPIIAAVDMAHHNLGIALLRGLPHDDISEKEFELLNWAIGLQIGVARPQGIASQYISQVRDIGTDYRAKTGRGYSSNARLDFHTDGCDLVTLACYNKAKLGGRSLITSSVSAWQMLCTERPDLAEVAHHSNFYFSRQNEQAEDEGPYYQQPLFDFEDGRIFAKWNRNRIRTAQLIEGVPGLTPEQIEVTNLLDEILSRPKIMLKMYLEPGDLQILNNHVMLHSRTDYVDHIDLEDKRLLSRLWLAPPDSVQLPDSWGAYFRSTGSGTVRGGIRGQLYNDLCINFEQRQAKYMGMPVPISSTSSPTP
jgi:hypothetical protein